MVGSARVVTTSPEPEDDLRAMIEGMAFDETPEVESITTLTNHELVVRFNEVQRDIKRSGEILVAKTTRGRELHSLNSALILEMHKRGLR